MLGMIDRTPKVTTDPGTVDPDIRPSDDIVVRRRKRTLDTTGETAPVPDDPTLIDQPRRSSPVVELDQAEVEENLQRDLKEEANQIKDRETYGWTIFARDPRTGEWYVRKGGRGREYFERVQAGLNSGMLYKREGGKEYVADATFGQIINPPTISTWREKTTSPTTLDGERPFNPTELVAAKNELEALLATRDAAGQEQAFKDAIALVRNEKEKNSVRDLLNPLKKKMVAADTKKMKDRVRKRRVEKGATGGKSKADINTHGLTKDDAEAALREAAERKRERIAAEEGEKKRWENTANTLTQAYDVLDRGPRLLGEPIVPPIDGTGADALLAHQTDNRPLLKKFWDWVTGNRTPPPRVESLSRILSDPYISEAEKSRHLLVEAQNQERDGYRSLRQERGISESRWNRITEKLYLKGIGKALVGTAIALPIAAVGLSLIGVGGIPAASAVAGAFTAAIINRITNNAMEEAGYGKKARFVASLILGGFAGVEMAGAVHAAGFDQWVSNVWHGTSAPASAPAGTTIPPEASTNIPDANAPVRTDVTTTPPGVEAVSASGPTSIVNTLTEYTVRGGTDTANSGIDGFVKSVLLKDPYFSSLHLNPLSQEQLIDALRTTTTDNPRFAQKLMNATGRIVMGDDGLDLMFRAGDKLNLTLFQDHDFLTTFKENILARERTLTSQLERAGGVAKFIAKLGMRA